MGYSITEKPPSLEKLYELRKKSGLSPRSVEVAAAILPRTIYGVIIINDVDNSVVGMGRLVGDGHLFLTVVNVTVLPKHQKQGLGRIIMEYLMLYAKNYVSKECFVGLQAVSDASTFTKNLDLFLPYQNHWNTSYPPQIKFCYFLFVAV